MLEPHPGDDAALVRLSALSRHGVKLSNVLHHIADPRALERVRRECRADASVGADQEPLGAVDLSALSREVLTGVYFPRPAREEFIPKTSGGFRRIVVPCSRDKIVQASLGRIVRAVWTPALAQDVSVSWRSHGTHRAAPWYASKRCRWILETDLAQCFDTLRRDKLLSALGTRIIDRRVARLVSGIMGGPVGVPQGYACAPALCEVYLTAAMDEWWAHWRRETAYGATFACRYVDDAVFGFERGREARAFAAALPARLDAWGLALRAEKTILRPAVGPLRFLGLDRPRSGGKFRVPGLTRRVALCDSEEAIVGLWRYYRRSCSRRSLGAIRRAA